MHKFKNRFLCAVAAFAMTAALVVPTALMQESNAAGKVTPKPVTLTKIASPDYNKVKISWKKVSGATHYKIYYRETGTKKWNGVKTVSNRYSSYTHTSNKSDPIEIGKKYDYTVRGYNSKYKTNGRYNSRGLTIRTLPESPKLEKPIFNDNDKSVSLKWKQGKGCDSYYIYRKTSEKGKWNKVDVVDGSKSSYLDIYPMENMKNSYTVKGYNKKNKVFSESLATVESIVVPDFGIKDEGWEEFPPEYSWPVEKLAKEVARLANIEREKRGIPPFIYHTELEKGAMIRAKEISYFFSHTRPNGQDSGTAAEQFDIGDVGGENIAEGQKTPERVVEAWMDSPGHRKAMLNPTNVYLGVGVYRDETGRLYWVQNFAGAKANDKVTLFFNPNGGTCKISSMAYPYNNRIYQKDMPIPVRPGYTFKGWTWYNETVPAPGYPTDGDIYFTALWE